MSTTVRDRLCAALGAAFVVLVFVGNGMSTAGADQSSHPSGESVLRDVARTHTSGAATVGFALEVLGFVALMGFLGFLLDLFRRYGGASRVPAASAVVGGLVMLAVKLGSAAPAVALDVDRGTLSPQLAQLLNDLNGAAFVISWLPFAVLVGALATALRDAGAVGRPTAYLGLVLGTAGLALAVLGLQDYTSANPVAFLLGSLWLLVVSVRLAVRPLQPTTAAPVDTGRRVPVSA
jgi:hypothetical protein